MQGSTPRDYYETLQVSHAADPLIITKAFRILMGLYHPDNKDSGDAEMFRQVVEAHQVLSDPLRRAAYDRATFASADCNGSRASLLPPVPDQSPLDERQLRRLILDALYTVRRSRPSHPGVSLSTLVELCGCSIDAAQFSLWYLRGKKLIDTTTDSEIAITVGGVDWVEAAQPSTRDTAMPLPALPASHGQLHAGNRHGRREDALTPGFTGGP